MVKYLNCFKAMNRFWTEIETKNKTKLGQQRIGERQRNLKRKGYSVGKKRSELDVLKLQVAYFGF